MKKRLSMTASIFLSRLRRIILTRATRSEDDNYMLATKYHAVPWNGMV